MRARTRIALPAVLVSLLALGCAGGGSQQQTAPPPMRAGAQIWGDACNNCHNLRQGTEYSAREWPIIVRHMRTRAGLTRSQAEAVAVFLQTVAERASQGS